MLSLSLDACFLGENYAWSVTSSFKQQYYPNLCVVLYRISEVVCVDDRWQDPCQSGWLMLRTMFRHLRFIDLYVVQKRGHLIVYVNEVNLLTGFLPTQINL